MPAGCIETLSAWYGTTDRKIAIASGSSSGAVKEDLRRATLVSLPVPTQAQANRWVFLRGWYRALNRGANADCGDP